MVLYTVFIYIYGFIYDWGILNIYHHYRLIFRWFHECHRKKSRRCTISMVELIRRDRFPLGLLPMYPPVSAWLAGKSLNEVEVFRGTSSIADFPLQCLVIGG